MKIRVIFLKKTYEDLYFIVHMLTLLDTSNNNFRRTYHRETCTPIFVAGLFMLTMLWNQVRFPRTVEWKRKRGTCMQLNISAIKKKTVLCCLQVNEFNWEFWFKLNQSQKELSSVFISYTVYRFYKNTRTIYAYMWQKCKHSLGKQNNNILG